MNFEEKQAARDACVRGVPFNCGGHCIRPVPFGYVDGLNLCHQCEMDSECKGDILEMCEYVNGFIGKGKYSFKFLTQD